MDADPPMARMRGSISRSYLFVPATRPDRIHKAFASGAHDVIVDLEDAVAPADKDLARQRAASSMTEGRPVIIRINASGTPWFERDLALCQGGGVSAIMLAKAESPAVVRDVGRVAPVIALIESALGFHRLDEMASVENLRCLAFGAFDLQLDLGMQADFDDLLYFRSQLVMASRLAGLAAPIDSPSLAIDNAQVVEREARSARRLGFGAKLCIHPQQVAAVHAAFDHGKIDLRRARAIVEGARDAQGGAFALDGRMVDRPVIEQVRRWLAETHAASESPPRGEAL